MDLLIDVQALQSPTTRQRGIDRYARNLIAALGQVRPAWRIELVQTAHWPGIDAARLTDLPLCRFHPPLEFALDHREANECYYADWLTARRPDAILLTNIFDDQVIVPRFMGARPSVFAVLYDIIPLIFHDHYLITRAERANYGDRLRCLLAADGVLAISKATAADLRSVVGEPLPKLTVLGGASDPAFASPPDVECEHAPEQLREELGLAKEFILYVGGFDWRKNLKGAMESFAGLPSTLRQQLDLVIVCQLIPEHRRQVEAWGRELGITGELRLPGYVTDHQLRGLYRLCRVFFFPSIYEGLGFPVLEALRCGASVVASNRAGVPEVAQPVARLVDPEKSADATEALLAALREERAEQRRHRIEHACRFTWAGIAERAAEALEVKGPRAAAWRRRRIAWVSPLPPAMTGIADYSAELVEGLSDQFDIELVVDPAERSVAPALAGSHLVLSADEVPARHQARPYDLFIYHVGNHHHHAYMVRLMHQFAGLVVLHDYYLGGLVWAAMQQGGWPVGLADDLELEGKARLAADYREERIGVEEILHQVALNQRILSWAEAVVVHSGWAEQRLQSRFAIPVVRLPLVASVPRLLPQAEERRRLGLADDAFIVATLGFVERTKCIESLFRAVAALDQPIRDQIRILVVGRAEPEQEKGLRALADRLGIRSAIQFMGRVPLDDFAAYARAADVCVQLRYPSRGEISAALLRALGAGAACVISNHGSMAEIPDGVVLKVRPPEHDVADVTAALTQLYSDPELRPRLGKAAEHYVRNNHDSQAIIALYAAAIDVTIAQRQSRDADWQELACGSLARVRDRRKADRLVGSWPALRYKGQLGLGERRTLDGEIHCDVRARPSSGENDAR
jgi:glycosyltransferase involved in cell wall biosynthesis